MNRIVLALLASAALADAPKLPSTEEALVADPTQAKFNPVTVEGIPPGPMASPIAVDPATKASIGYAKIPAKYDFPKHWHSQTEYTVLISGSAIFTVDGKPHEMVPGSYIVIPAKAQHELHCGGASDCILLTRRAGPTDYNFVK
jgi:quercetin dioxygenase-like cupin family protein